MPCKICSDPTYKHWKGDDPRCAFDSGEFSSNNWNCGTVQTIRSFLSWVESETTWHIRGVSLSWHDDTFMALISTDNFPPLYVSWYKHRGSTEEMWFMGEGITYRPREEDIISIAMSLEQTLPKWKVYLEGNKGADSEM